MIAAQVSADRKSRATQRAKSTNRMARTVRVIVRARESMGSAAFLAGQSSLCSSLGVDRAWPGIFDRILVAQVDLDLGRARSAAAYPANLPTSRLATVFPVIAAVVFRRAAIAVDVSGPLCAEVVVTGNVIISVFG